VAFIQQLYDKYTFKFSEKEFCFLCY